MIQIELRLLGTQVLELQVGRKCDDSDSADEEYGSGTEVDPRDYIWRNGQPVALSPTAYAHVDEELSWDDLAELKQAEDEG